MSEYMKNIDLLNSTKNQFVQLQKNFKEFKIVDFEDVALYSWVNFFRYLPHLEKYLLNLDFYLIVTKQELSINFKTDEMSLMLAFQTNGITRFLCQDKENDVNETQTFIIVGEISTSNLLKNNYKILRLLRILNCGF